MPTATATRAKAQVPEKIQQVVNAPSATDVKTRRWSCSALRSPCSLMFSLELGSPTSSGFSAHSDGPAPPHTLTGRVCVCVCVCVQGGEFGGGDACGRVERQESTRGRQRVVIHGPMRTDFAPLHEETHLSFMRPFVAAARSTPSGVGPAAGAAARRDYECLFYFWSF